MPRLPQPVPAAAEPSPTRLLPVRIHTDNGRVFLSVGAAHRPLSPAEAHRAARHLLAAADTATDSTADAPEHAATVVGWDRRTPHAYTLPGGLVGLRFDTAALTLTEDHALRLADKLADAAEATRDVLGTGDPQ